MGEVHFHIIPVYGEVVKEPTINFHTILLQGGKGSGNFGHSGIPGQVGGSGAGGSADYQKFDDAQNFNNEFSKRSDLDAQVTKDEVHIMGMF